MWNMSRKMKLYLFIAFGWTWSGWGGAFFLSRRSGRPLETDITLFSMFGDFPGTPFSILTGLMAWAFVWWIEKKHGDLIKAVNGKPDS